MFRRQYMHYVLRSSLVYTKINDPLLGNRKRNCGALQRVSVSRVPAASQQRWEPENRAHIIAPPKFLVTHLSSQLISAAPPLLQIRSQQQQPSHHHGVRDERGPCADRLQFDRLQFHVSVFSTIFPATHNSCDAQSRVVGILQRDKRDSIKIPNLSIECVFIAYMTRRRESILLFDVLLFLPSPRVRVPCYRC